ncbi:MAG: FecR family protein, partial [Pedobacter sp.]
PKRNWYYFSAAASIIFICFIFWFSNFFLAHKQSSIFTAQTIQPGSNKAELILADGSIIAIAEKENGIVANQDNSHIVKNGNGQIVYSEAQSNNSSPADDTGQANAKIVYNTLRTPKGGQYQVVLTDGTRVWLNAASSITFPTVFSGSERIVEASGEAYFEVAKNPKKPFKVISKGHVITVLGTHFNLYAYAEDPYVKTTLLEGSVQVSAHYESVIIKPGQQSTYDVNNQKLSTRTINAEGAIAWKEGYFEFNNEDLPTIMKKLSRWYDIDVQYDKTFVNQRFNGSVSRFEDAAKVLKMLEYTGTVHFKINGRRIVVMP